ncbi:MAG: AAA family ATPase, partial [Candidatus Omnitrophica bacterium]|nr:AAA family ATPase [Candidatus Omnitrophota bacterium]
YEAYWGLTEKPFENTPNARFFYRSRQHEEALARMLYVVHERKGAAVLTGDYGCGKTLLNRVLWQELQSENQFQAVNILDPSLSAHELVQEIVYQLSGAPAPQVKIDLFHTLHNLLYANHKAGRHNIIVVDEAQLIKEPAIFEELRLLLNFQLDNAFLLTIILLGSSELQQIIDGLPHLAQRLAARFHLVSLSQEETRFYIEHRLKIAGATRQVFNDGAFGEIFAGSAGVPRNINNICDLALVDGFSNNLEIVDAKAIVEINNELRPPVARASL